MENNLDKLFKSKLGGQEPEFDPAAWGRMEELLDDAGMIPAPKKKSNRKVIFFLFLLFLGISVSINGYKSLMKGSTDGEGSTAVNEKNVLQPKNNIDRLSNESVESSINESNTNQKVNKNIEPIASDISSDLQVAESNNELNNIESKGSEGKNDVLRSNNQETTFKNTQPESSEKIINTENSSNLLPKLSAQLLGQVNIDEGSETKSSETKLGPKETLETLNESANINLENKNEIEQGLNVKAALPFIDILNTRSGTLNSIPSLVSPQIETANVSIFTIGVMASARFKDGFGYSVGPYISYNIGKGYALNLGGQFDSQDFGAGPQMSVVDKVYSFGSELSERTFSLTNQKSLRMPLSVTKSFSKFSLITGVIINRVIASSGSISTAGDGSIEENVIIDSDMVNPMTLSYQMGASVDMSRHLALDFGLEFKTKAFVTDLSTSNDSNKYYPTVGLRYKLFKF